MQGFGWARLAFLTMAVIAVSSPVLADDAELGASAKGHSESKDRSDLEEHDGAADSHHGSAHKNEVAIFLGATDEPGHDSEFTWGLDYKRRIAERWAVGVIVDYAGGELRNSVVAPSVSFWPGLGDLQLIAAAGVEFHAGRKGGATGKSGGGDAQDKDATYFLFRLGVGYDIPLGKGFGLAPQINLDLVNSEEVWVYGFAVSYGF